jgi:hypothetical protein
MLGNEAKPACGGSRRIQQNGRTVMTVRQESMIKRNHLALVVAAMLTIASLPARAQPSDGIPGVLAPGAVPELVQEGFVFTEGPVGTADGALYFSDRRLTQHSLPGGLLRLTWAGLAPADRASFAWRLPLCDNLVGARASNAAGP